MKRPLFATVAVLAITSTSLGQAIDVDFSEYKADCGIEVQREGQKLNVAWPMAENEFGRLTIDLTPGKLLFANMGTGDDPKGEFKTILGDVEPSVFLTVGTRQAPDGRPPGMSEFNVFFDTPAKRPYDSYLSRLDRKRARVTSQGKRATIEIGDLVAGPFTGALQVNLYCNSRLVHVEAVVATNEEHRAFLYDAGLIGDKGGWDRFGWVDTEGNVRNENVTLDAADRPLQVRYRTLAAETNNGTIAVFPPPHQYFFPRDLTDNLAYVWYGRSHRDNRMPFGFGIRQSETGGGNFVPWFNAPPGTKQRLGVFYLLSKAGAEDTLREAVKFTHADRFPDMDGRVKFTSHWHMAVAMAAMQQKARGQDPATPDFVDMFKNMGVDIVHLAEFHGDGHPRDPGPLRLAEMQAMFDECKRLSNDKILFLPGEEANVYLGLDLPGRHPGHWVYLFPNPVYWIMQRQPAESFLSTDPKYGPVYRVGSLQDMMALLQKERGLAWSSHPRIKASSWTPDAFRDQAFYKADYWLGAAWKAMPADLSRPKLGERSLDVLSDMDNWGQKKYMPGEVDVFKLDHTHELYGHMNINYLKLDKVPSYADGWQPVVDALRQGQFFVTTGEVLIRDFQVGGKASGETIEVASGRSPEVKVALDWTFPLRFLEVVSGDGKSVYHERIDLPETEAFGQREFTFTPKIPDRKWVRVEVWDVAANGAFTQPVWLGSR